MSRTTTALACVCAVLASAAAAPAAMAGPKQFSVTMTPGSSPVSPTQEFTATIRNLDTRQTLGSVNLTAPSYVLGTGFDLDPATVTTTAGTARVVGEVVQLRQLALKAGETAVVTVVADTTSTAGAWDWSAAGKQANDFNGVGNDFDLVEDRSRLRTEVTAPDGVSVDCPQDEVGRTDVCKLTVSWRGTGPVPRGSDEPILPPVGATARSGAEATGTTDFVVTMSVVSVPDRPLLDNSGLLRATLPTTQGIDCPILSEASPVTGLITGPLNRRKTTSLTIDAGVALGGPAPAVCYGGQTPSVPNPAYPLPGQPRTFGSDLGTVLLFPFALADCTIATQPVSACTSSRGIIDGNQVSVVEVPSSLPDPAYRG